MGYDDVDLYTAITLQAAADLDNLSPADVSHILWACGEQGHICNKFMSGGWQHHEQLQQLRLVAVLVVAILALHMTAPASAASCMSVAHSWPPDALVHCA